MNSDLENKLWNAGQKNEKYSQEAWYQIIDALLEDFKVFIGASFRRDSKIYLDNDEPSFGQWMWSEKSQKYIISTVWTAVIGGQMAGGINGDDIFYVGVTLFLFDTNSKKRLCLSTGESILEFVFEKDKEHGYWRNLGWSKDANYEWENVEYE